MLSSEARWREHVEDQLNLLRDRFKHFLTASQISAVAEVPAVHVYRSTAQEIPDATETAIIFSHSRFDYDEMWTISAPSRLTCKTPGVYIAVGGFAWESNPDGLRGAKIKLNGTTWIGRRMHSGVAGKYMGCATPPYLLEYGDYLELFASHIDTGGTLDVLSVGNTSPEFGMVRLPGQRGGAGDGAGAPTDASYVTTEAEAGLSAEKVLGANVIMQGLAAAKPAAGIAGLIYIETDGSRIVWRDNGAGWDEIARGEVGIRLAQLAEKAHASTTGRTADDHHAEDHAAEHQDGGDQEISVAGLLGELTDPQPPKAHTLASHSTKAHTELTGVTSGQHHIAVPKFYPLPSPWVSQFWDGDDKGDTASTLIDVSNEFGEVTTGIVAYAVRISAVGSGAGYFTVSGHADPVTNMAVIARPSGAGVADDGSGVVPATAAGDFYYASSNCNAHWIQIHGYWKIP